ncbi:GspH/FimT family pseudopilin [Motiliproteus sp. SC1-56]|uniref:GspH/FimT family pseudopilin n=1 Tax=Motiliproteus sp. SC1-56 TaxID=2799565 RepID=UPI001A8CFF11
MLAQRGFSLVELTVTVTLAALVLAIGVPSFQSLSHKNHAEAHLEELNSALRLARHVAIEHGRPTRVCPRKANTAATASAQCDTSASGDWNRGWVVEMVNGPTTLMSRQHTPDDTNLSASGSLKEINFSPTGTLTIPNATFTITMGNCTKKTLINISGHLSFDQSGC